MSSSRDPTPKGKHQHQHKHKHNRRRCDNRQDHASSTTDTSTAAVAVAVRGRSNTNTTPNKREQTTAVATSRAVRRNYCNMSLAEKQAFVQRMTHKRSRSGDYRNRDDVPETATATSTGTSNTTSSDSQPGFQADIAVEQVDHTPRIAVTLAMAEKVARHDFWTKKDRNPGDKMLALFTSLPGVWQVGVLEMVRSSKLTRRLCYCVDAFDAFDWNSTAPSCMSFAHIVC